MSQALPAQVLVDELRRSFRGPVIERDDPDYDAIRRIWNGAIDRRPALVARCTGAADVIAALTFACERDLPVAVRGGGHNVAGTALCEGGLVIDLQLMRGLRIDPAQRRLYVQPGLRLADVDHETEAFGLAAVSGINSETGISGLILGGGIGWLMRKHGLTIDHLIAADVVTTEGELVRTSADEDPDLFWALRGGGGNFGVVTGFELSLVPLGPAVYGGVALYPSERAREVLVAYRDWAASAPREVTTILLFRRNFFPWTPAELQGRPVLGVGALHAGDADSGPAALAPLEGFGPLLASSFGLRRWTQHQSMLDASAPPGRLYYWKSHYLPAPNDATLEVIAQHAWRFSSPYSFTLLSQMGGAIRDRSDDDTAFTGREAEFTININCAATEPGLFEQDRAWVREWFDALSPHSTGGVYVNFLGEEGAERVRAAYGAPKYERLSEMKARYDPRNLLRINQNIVPAE